MSPCILHLIIQLSPMKTKLSPAAQDRILSACPWTPDGEVLLTCTHRTVGLLRDAGIPSPRVLQAYPVPVHRELRSGKMLLLLGPPRMGAIAENERDSAA